MAEHKTLDLPLQDSLQPPMANGEVLFAEPWQGRVFAMAIALHEAGVFGWHEFQAALIEAIAAWEQAQPIAAGQASDEQQQSQVEATEYRYYDHFQAALDAVLQSRRVVTNAELMQRATELAARPHGHDHPHRHE